MTSKTLKNIRTRAKLTQAQLAKRIKRSQALVSHAECGRWTPTKDYTARVREACAK